MWLFVFMKQLSSLSISNVRKLNDEGECLKGENDLFSNNKDFITIQIYEEIEAQGHSAGNSVITHDSFRTIIEKIGLEYL